MPSIRTQQALGWGNPDAADFRSRNITTLTTAGISVTVNRLLVPIFDRLIDGIDALGANLDQKRDDWGYANRDIRGVPGSKSYHAWGLAVDLDATENPLGATRTTFPERPTRDLAHALGLRWGLDYDGRKDPMHFEFVGSVADAKRIAQRIQRPPFPLKRDHFYGHKRTEARWQAKCHDGYGSRADEAAVRRIQKWVGVKQDGWFGWETKEAVMRKQRESGIKPTGRVDLATARAFNIWS